MHNTNDKVATIENYLFHICSRSMADVVSMTSIAGLSTFPLQRLEEPNTSLEKERYEIEKILTTTEAENPDLHRGDNSNVIDSDSTVGLETADNAGVRCTFSMCSTSSSA